MLTQGDCLALLMHGQLIPGPRSQGKMGHGLLRYGSYPIAAVIDREHAGQTSTDVTGIPGDVPIVATIDEAIQLGANTLIPGIAPPGGILPSSWSDELIHGLLVGCNLINGLHKPMVDDPMYASALQEDCWIWDVRVEPPGLRSGTGAAAAIDPPSYDIDFDTATAVIGTLRFGIGALAGPLLAWFYNGTPLPFALLMLGGVLCIAASQLWHRTTEPDAVTASD